MFTMCTDPLKSYVHMSISSRLDGMQCIIIKVYSFEIVYALLSFC